MKININSDDHDWDPKEKMGPRNGARLELVQVLVGDLPSL